MKIAMTFLSLFILVLSQPVITWAEESATPAESTEATVPMDAMMTDAELAAMETEATLPEAGEEALDMATEELENVEFVTGEVSQFDKANQNLTAKIYLNNEGDSVDETIQVKVVSSTIITDGDADLTSDELTPNREVDIEYNSDTKEATYIFVY